MKDNNKSYKRGVQAAYYWNKAAGLYILNSREVLQVGNDCYYNVLLPAAWCLNIEEQKWEGRTIKELWQTLEQIAQDLELKAQGDKATRLCVFVDSFRVSFEYLKEGREFLDIVAKDWGKPIKALDSSGIEFRSLDDYRGQEEVQNLEPMDIINISPSTPLTPQELHKIATNSTAIMEYIQKHIKLYNGAANIALTSVRTKATMKHELYNKQNRANTVKLFDKLTLEPEEYKHCLAAMWGGFSYTNPKHESMLCSNIRAYDINSDYLAQQFCRLMPMDKRDTYKNPKGSILKDILRMSTAAGVPILSIVYVEAENIKTNNTELAFLINAEDRFKCEGIKEHQGHIIEAKKLAGWMSILDYHLISTFYKTDSTKLTIKEAIVFNSGLMPNAFINEALRRYKAKTAMKGDKEADPATYADHKSNINAGFGIHAQSILKDSWKLYKGNWGPIHKNDQDITKEMGRKYGRFQWLPWGVFISAWARFQLLSTISQAIRGQSDWLTADTDSCYFINPDSVAKYVIAEINKQTRQSMLWAMDERNKQGGNYKVEDWELRDSKGNLHSLGAFEIDGEYNKAKSLHAKCHLFQDKAGEWKLTLAGTPNKPAKQFITATPNPWATFDSGLILPASPQGKCIDKPLQASDPTQKLPPIYYKDRDGKQCTIELHAFFVRLFVPFSLSTIEQDI